MHHLMDMTDPVTRVNKIRGPPQPAESAEDMASADYLLKESFFEEE